MLKLDPRALVCSFALAASAISFAGAAPTTADVTGTWSGMLHFPSASLLLVITFSNNNGALSATAASPYQGASALPIDRVAIDGTTLTFSSTRLQLSFTGTIAPNAIAGTFTQRGVAVPLTLVRSSLGTSDLAGTWLGTLHAGGSDILLGLTIAHGAGSALSATLDSPSQGATGIAVTSIAAENGTLTFSVARLGASYTGHIGSDSIVGTFVQGGAQFPLTFARPQPTVAAGPAPTPVPLPAARYTSADVHFTSADGTVLAGTLTVPNGPLGRRPAVVLVNGSGSVNRDEVVGPNAVFLQIANALSNAGYVVLRYDKRGVGHSGGDALTMTRPQLLADARAALAYVRSLHAVDPHRVFMLGHSEGGELVPSVAAGSSELAGIVLMAPPALPLRDVIMEQALESVPPSQREAERSAELAALQQIRTGAAHDAGDPWLRTSIDVDPIVAIEQVRVPILILQGGSDVQVLPKDLPRLVRAARLHDRDVSVHVFPGDNHLFMKVTPGEPLTPQAAVHQYMTVPGYVDPAAISTLIRWLNAHGA